MTLNKSPIKKQLRVKVEKECKYIKPARIVPGRKPLDNPLPLNYPIYPSPSPESTPNPEKEATSNYKYVLSCKSFGLREVKNDEILIQYKFLSNEEGLIKWESPPPTVPLLLEMRVGRTTTLIELDNEFIERTYSSNGSKSKASFRRVKDVRGYNDTYILSDWSANDVCFYLRTLTLNYLVDSHPLSSSLETWKCIVWKHELLSKERLLKISGGDFYLSPDDILKLERISGLQKELGDF